MYEYTYFGIKRMYGEREGMRFWRAVAFYYCTGSWCIGNNFEREKSKKRYWLEPNLFVFIRYSHIAFQVLGCFGIVARSDGRKVILFAVHAISSPLL